MNIIGHEKQKFANFNFNIKSHPGNQYHLVCGKNFASL